MAISDPSESYSFYDPYIFDDDKAETYENGVQLGKDLEQIQEHMTDLLSFLYGKESLNLEDLDDTMDKLCAYLNVKIPPGLPTVQRYNASHHMMDVTKTMLQKAGIEF